MWLNLPASGFGHCHIRNTVASIQFVSFEVLLWAFCMFMFVILFYEYFFEKRVREKSGHSRSSKFLIFTLFYLCLVYCLIFSKSTFVRTLLVFNLWNAGYFASVLWRIPFPKVFPKLLKTAIYFFYLNLLYEITALKIGWWSFPSKQFIVRFLLWGRFPFESFSLDNIIHSCHSLVLWVLFWWREIVPWMIFKSDYVKWARSEWNNSFSNTHESERLLPLRHSERATSRRRGMLHEGRTCRRPFNSATLFSKQNAPCLGVRFVYCVEVGGVEPPSGI